MNDVVKFLVDSRRGVLYQGVDLFSNSLSYTSDEVFNLLGFLDKIFYERLDVLCQFLDKVLGKLCIEDAAVVYRFTNVVCHFINFRVDFLEEVVWI